MKMQNPPNARFWIYWNRDWVKMTMWPGDKFTLYMSHPTEEGWAYHGEEYVYDTEGLRIERTVDSGGSDCDGPIDHHTDYVCPVDQLTANTQQPCDYRELPPRPDWTKVKSWQRDHFAEAAGY